MSFNHNIPKYAQEPFIIIKGKTIISFCINKMKGIVLHFLNLLFIAEKRRNLKFFS